MKKLFFILCSLLLYISSFSQSYKPCLDGEIIRWSFLDNHDVADAGVYSTEIVAYGDTLINNVMYKTLYLDYAFEYKDTIDAEENNINWENYKPSINYLWENFYIRESEDASKLYIYNSYLNKESLISDVNLQEGDTTQILYHNIDIKVNSIYFKEGLKHIDLQLVTYPFYQFTFIESVGSTMWFIYPYFYTHGLNCFHNQSIFYKTNVFENLPCGYCSSYAGINITLKDNYHVFVQKNKIEILFTSNMNVDISIYDIQGKLCYSRNNVFDKKIVISTVSIPKGIYILKIFDKKNYQVNSKKFIIQ